MNQFTLLSQKVLKNLKNKNLYPTPKNYEREFFNISKEENILIEEKVELDEIFDGLCTMERISIDDENLTFNELSKVLLTRINESQIKQFLRDLSYFMTPSLAKEMSKEINTVCEEISNNPNELINFDNIRKLRHLTKERLNADKTFFNEKAEDVKELLRFLAKLFAKSVNKNDMTIEKIIDIKNEMKNLDLSQSSIKQMNILQTKLLDALEDFEKNINKNIKDLEKSKKSTEALHEEIEDLKKSLDKAEEEKAIDYLTKLLTRRAFSIEQERIENEFKVFDSNYAIVFFDIDHFKKINDELGHDCGDSVLFTFSSILKKLTRSEDIICRYGGEEFISIVHYKNKLEIKNYLNRVKNIITNNKFVYKEHRFDVKFSAGVAYRAHYNSYKETLIKADKLLYKAKSKGRNKIILDTNDEL